MKQTLFILFVCITASACNTTEYGSLDYETLSRKLFDTMRNNDLEKSEYLLPDKGTFRKMNEQNGIVHEDVDEAYNTFKALAASKFTQVNSMLSSWENTKYLHATAEAGKYGNLVASIVTSKFDANGDPSKITFTAVKYNNRWYYMGDITWIAKTL